MTYPMPQPVGQKRRWSRRLLIVIALVCSIYALYRIDEGRANRRVVAAKKSGGTIRAAIDAYVAQKSTLPSTLDELVPTFLTARDLDVDGRSWKYSASHGHSLKINLSTTLHRRVLTYSTLRGDWFLDSGF
ncbi:MAG: hypothetical protein H7Z14_08185 [Anaerolineae bacterium]|nr:hypothetical protein [Phycisphaerae bacterium]